VLGNSTNEMMTIKILAAEKIQRSGLEFLATGRTTSNCELF